MPFAKLVQLFRFAHARRGHIVRTLAADSKRSFWAMADQLLVSLGNFLLGLFLARHFDRHHDLQALGAFGLLMGVVYFLRGVHAAVVVYPLSVRGAVLNPQQLSGLSTWALAATAISWPVQAALVLGTAKLWGMGMQAGLWAAAAMLAWQVQETLRRSLMAHLRFRTATLGDAIAYLGPLAAVIFLGSRRELGLPTIFMAMAAASTLAALLQALQVRLARAAWLHLRDFSRQSWQLGRWVLLGSSLSNFFTHTLFEWNMAWWLGTEKFGIFYAIVSMVRLANPLAFAVASLVVPNAARVRRLHGMHHAKRVMQRFTLLGALGLIPYLGLLLLLPQTSIAMFYGQGSEYLGYGLTLRLLSVATALSYASICLSAFLNAVEHSRDSFVAQASCAAAFLLIAMPLTAVLGLAGAAMGWLIALAIDVAVNTYFIGRLPSEQRSAPQTSTVTLGSAPA
jgi:O-antigen/teichoic acid export membrane protein